MSLLLRFAAAGGRAKDRLSQHVSYGPADGPDAPLQNVQLGQFWMRAVAFEISTPLMDGSPRRMAPRRDVQSPRQFGSGGNFQPVFDLDDTRNVPRQILRLRCFKHRMHGALQHAPRVSQLHPHSPPVEFGKTHKMVRNPLPDIARGGGHLSVDGCIRIRLITCLMPGSVEMARSASCRSE